MNGTQISDQTLIDIFYSPESPCGYAGRTYELTWSYDKTGLTEVQTFHAWTLADAKVLAREFVTRFKGGIVLSVTYLGKNK